MIDGQCSLTEKQAHHVGKKSIKGGQCTYLHNCSAPPVEWCDVARVTIDMLPDIALLEIFEFYLDDLCGSEKRIEVWHTLVHVCQKWRNIVFGSPRRLNLRVCITECAFVETKLAIWPLLPIVIDVDIGELWAVFGEEVDWGGKYITEAFEHNDHICEINIFKFPSSESGTVLPAMHRLFPTLTRLELEFGGETPVQPQADSFLGGSAPRLRHLRLDSIPFPGLPKLLLSATHLVLLELWGIPHSGYLSPEAVATCLSVLTSLEGLIIGFKSSRSLPNRRPPPQKRTLLPALTKFAFNGDNEYLEDIVAGIDAPLLDTLATNFFHQLTFDTTHLTRFISSTPKFKGHKAHIEITDWNVSVALPQTSDKILRLNIECENSDLELSSLAQVCHAFFPRALIHAVEYLYINHYWFITYWDQDIVESRQWLDLLRPFSTLKCLYISEGFLPRIAPALKELIGDRATEVLPALQTLFLEEEEEGEEEEPVWVAIRQFIAARQVAGHPIAVYSWKYKPIAPSFGFISD